MAFETSSTFISVRTSSLETKLKEKFALFLYSDVIARILGWFLHLAIALEYNYQDFLPKNHNFFIIWEIEILYSICKEVIQFFLQLLRNLLIKSSFLLQWDLLFQEDEFFLTRKV